MPRYHVSLRVDPVDTARQNDFRRELYHRFGLKLFSSAWADFDLLSWPRLSELVDVLEDLDRRDVARPGSAILIEQAEAIDIDRAEWFLLRAEPYVEDFDLTSYPSIRADRVPPGRHISSDGRFVSERFKAAVERAELSGVEFLWMEDTGKYRAPQWYIPVAHHYIGYGVELKTGWTTGNAIADRFLSMFPTDSSLGLMIQMLRRYDRSELPATDAAYDWFPDGESPGRPRFRTLCVNSRGRRILLDAGVIADSEVEPVVIVDVALSTRRESAPERPLPMYTPPELAQLRVEEQSRRAMFLRRQKPERRPTLSRSLKLLRDARKARPGDFRPGARQARIGGAQAALGVIFPGDWIEVLKIADGGSFSHGEDDCQIVPLDELPAFHRDLFEYGRKTEDDYPDRYLNVGVTATGDYFALDLDEDRAAREGVVVRFSHETLQIERRWNSVAAFLEAILAG